MTMAKCPVARLADFKEYPLRRVEADGIPICLARLDSGEVFAISDVCSHEEIELSDGELDGEDVECPAHGSASTCAPARSAGCPPMRRSLPTRFLSRDGEIFVEVSQVRG